MNDETIQQINEQKISTAFKSALKLHIILKDKSWRNGYVKEISLPDFFIFHDDENGPEPIFFLELYKAEIYTEVGE